MKCNIMDESDYSLDPVRKYLDEQGIEYGSSTWVDMITVDLTEPQVKRINDMGFLLAEEDEIVRAGNNMGYRDSGGTVYSLDQLLAL